VLVKVLVAQTRVPVSVKFEFDIAVTDSLRVNAKTAPVELVVAFSHEFASFAQVRTGGVVSGIVAVVVADAVAIVAVIPFWPSTLNVPALVNVTAALDP
jgi:hypothetical protein